MARRSSKSTKQTSAPASSSNKSSPQSDQAPTPTSVGVTAADSAAAAPKWVSSYEQLGEIFGLHRASFPRLVKRLKAVGIDAPEPRANGDHDVDGWRQFFEEHPEIKRQAAEGTKNALEEAIQEEKLRSLRFDNDLKEGRYLWKSQVEAWVVDRAQQLQDRLKTKLKNELPPKLVGQTAEQIAVKMDRLIPDLIGILRGQLPAPARKTK